MRRFSRSPCFLNSSQDRLGDELLRLQIHFEVEIANPLRGRRPDRGNPGPADFARIIVKFVKHFKESGYAIWTGKNDPIIGVRILHQFGKGAEITRRLNPDRGQLDHLGSKVPQLHLLSAPACFRVRVTTIRLPASGRPSCQEVCAQRHNLAKNRHCWRREILFHNPLRDGPSMFRE